MALTDALAAGEWKFTPEVTAEFDEHVQQSVPHYAEMQRMIAELSDWLVPDGGTIADLGASTGTTIDAIAQRHPARTINAHLYDVEKHMLDAARDKLAKHSKLKANYHTTNICRELKHREADLTIASLTIQFLTDAQRHDALDRARFHSRKAGTLVLVEKVRQDHSEWQDIAAELTQERKALAGLSDKEIRDKQAAIRGVLRPHTTGHIVNELHASGWDEIDEVWRWHNWCMLVAKSQR